MSAPVDDVVMRRPVEGDRLVVIIPIDVAEDLRWEVGEQVEVSRVSEGSFEACDSNGVEASFADFDLTGDSRWFGYA